MKIKCINDCYWYRYTIDEIYDTVTDYNGNCCIIDDIGFEDLYDSYK